MLNSIINDKERKLINNDIIICYYILLFITEAVNIYFIYILGIPIIILPLFRFPGIFCGWFILFIKPFIGDI